MSFIVPEIWQCTQEESCIDEFYWDLFTGCTKKSAGCKNCYAEQKLRSSGMPFNLRFHSENFYPLPWEYLDTKLMNDVFEKGQRSPRTLMIRVCPTSDFFHTDILCCDPEIYGNDPLFSDLWIYKAVHNVIKQKFFHLFSFLTKRPDNMAWVLEYIWENDVPENTIYGVSVEDQETADERISVLLRMNVSHRFINVAPMLAPVELNLEPGMVEIVSCSGEYAEDPRPFDPAWAADLLEQCKAVGTDFYCAGHGSHFFKCEECEPGRYCQNPERLASERSCAVGVV